MTADGGEYILISPVYVHQRNHPTDTALVLLVELNRSPPKTLTYLRFYELCRRRTAFVMMQSK